MLSKEKFIETINEACKNYINFALFWVVFCITNVLKNIEVMLIIIPNIRVEREDNVVVKVPFIAKCKMELNRLQSLCYHAFGLVLFLPFACTKDIRYNLIANTIYFDINCTNFAMGACNNKKLPFEHKDWINKVKKGDISACHFF